jgi:putative membrane protein insertion efficiency factor
VVTAFVLLYAAVLGHPCTSQAVHRDVSVELAFVLEHNPIRLSEVKQPTGFRFAQTNELTLAFTGLVRIYQLFVSSQDSPTCAFTPSCSRFGMTALRRYGVLRGILMTSDRLQRCHGCSSRYYAPHHETGRCYDPVERNLLWDR